MRLTLAFIISIIFAVGLVAFGFTLFQSSTERSKLMSELEIRSHKVAEDLIQDNFNIENLNQNNIENFTDSLNKRYNLFGIATYFNADSIISNNSTRSFTNRSIEYISQAINADTTIGNSFTIEGRSIFQYIVPVNHSDISNRAVIFYTDAGYIDKVISKIWFRN